MPDHTTNTHQLCNLRQVSNYLLEKSTQDRQIMFTKWIDMLVSVGVAKNVNQACEMVGHDIGMTRNAVYYHYKGKKARNEK